MFEKRQLQGFENLAGVRMFFNFRISANNYNTRGTFLNSSSSLLSIPKAL